MLQLQPGFTQLNELVSDKVDGKILFATDDWFAQAENLISSEDVIFKPHVYTDFGKWMDGWETRRKRSPGHDWCLIKLGLPGIIKGIEVDTAFFTGNYTPKFSLQAAKLTSEDEKVIPNRGELMIGTAATPEEMEQIKQLGSEEWVELVTMSPLRPGFEDTRNNYFEVKSNQVWTHLRLNLYPDGGIARLRVYGEVFFDPSSTLDQTIDLIGMQNGGQCIGYSNAFYGHPRNLIQSRVGINMGDGWETARRLDRPPILIADEEGILQVPGHEWAVFKLGHVGNISSVEVDTNHFKGNFPDSIKVEGLHVVSMEKRDILECEKWATIVPTSKLSAHKVHRFENEKIVKSGPFTHIKIAMAPDGGISRVRVYGKTIIS